MVLISKKELDFFENSHFFTFSLFRLFRKKRKICRKKKTLKKHEKRPKKRRFFYKKIIKKTPKMASITANLD